MRQALPCVAGVGIGTADGSGPVVPGLARPGVVVVESAEGGCFEEDGLTD